MRKKTLCLLLVLCLVFSICPAASAAGSGGSFKDVPAGSWYADSVAYVYENGLMSGTGANTFAPEGTLTRGMFVTVLGRMDGMDPQTYSGSSFNDVKAGAYYAPYVEWAASLGLVNGTGGGKYSPDSTITREQMATMIARYVESARLDLPASDSPAAAFEDADQVSDYAQAGLELMRTTGLIQGSGGKFDPKATATRAQAAVIFMRLNQAVTVSPERFGGEVKAGSTGSGSERYSITGLTTESNKISATVCTDQPCVLVAQVFTEDGGASLARAAVRVAGGLGLEQVQVPLRLAEELPEHFLIAAVLRDEQGRDLSNTYVERGYTRAYQEFMALTPKSPRFDGKNVVDFDGTSANDSTQTNNFGVLADGVRQVDTASLTLAEDGLSCSYAGEELPQPEDVLYIVGANGESTVIKVGGAEKTGGTIQVTAADSACLGDFYQMLKVDLGGGAAGIAQQDGDHWIDVKMNSLHQALESEFDFGAASVALEGDFTGELEIRFDPVVLGEDYLYIRQQNTTQWTATLSAKYGVSDEALPESMTQKELCKPVTFKTGVPGLNVQLEAIGFVEFDLSAGIDLTGTNTQVHGYIHETGQPDQIISDEESTVDVSSKDKFQFGGGAKLRLNAGVGLGQKENALSAGVNGEIKVEVAGEVTGQGYEASTDDGEKHGCEICIDGEVALVPSCYLDLKYNLSKWLNGTFLKVELAKARVVLPQADFYCAVDYDPSYNAFDKYGLKTAGTGDCPNTVYKITAKTVDSQGEEVTGVPVSLTDDRLQKTFSGTSPYTAYMLKGSLEAAAQFESGQVKVAHSIQHGGGMVTLEEPSGSFSGFVRDRKGKAIAGAMVTVTQNGKTVGFATTNSIGSFRVKGLPTGKCAAVASAAGYTDSSPLNFNVAVGSLDHRMDFTLASCRAVEVKFERKSDNSAYKEYAVLTGINADGEVCWTYTTPKYTETQFYKTFDLGIHNDMYYLLHNGSISALDLADGSFLWTNSDFQGDKLLDRCYIFDSSGDLFISGEFFPQLFWLSPEGKTIARIKGKWNVDQMTLADGVITTHRWDNTGSPANEFTDRFTLSEIRGRIER